MTDAQSAQTALDKLIEAVEAGEIVNWMDFTPAIGMENAMRAGNAQFASLDAALALHEALLEKAPWRICMDQPKIYFCEIQGAGEPEGYATTPARAWLLAILRAYRSMQP